MLVLALDSSTRAGSLALAREGRVIDSRVGDAAVRHAVRLPRDLIDLLAAHGHVLSDVDLFAAAAGPGGFTGLRVGLATVQGLALALDRQVYLASTLDLLGLAALERMPDVDVFGAWMLGMRGEVFTALYRRGAEGDGLEPVVGASVGTPDACAAAWAAAGGDAGTIAVAGDAWADVSDPLRVRFGDRLRPCAVPPLAEVLALQALRHPDAATGPAGVRPAYVRRPDAVMARVQAGLPVTGDT